MPCFLRVHSRCFSRLWLITLLMALVLAHGPVYGHLADSRSDGFQVRAAWVGLASPDDLLRLEKPVLTLELVNREAMAMRLQADLRIVADGKVVHGRVPVRRLPAHGRMRLSLPLPRKTAHWQRLRYAGKIHLTLDMTPLGHTQGRLPTGHGANTVVLPTLYFHPQGEALLVYREQVLRERYGAGNFRGLRPGLHDPRPDFRKVLKQAGLGRVEPVQARVHQVHAWPGSAIDDMLPPGARRFCLVIDGFAYGDSSRFANEFGEDIGRAGDVIPLSRAWVAVGQQGNPLFSGFLDGDGCTPYVPTTLEEISIAFFPIYLHPGNGIRGFVSDRNLGDQWPDSMPWFLFDFQPVDTPNNQVAMDIDEYIYSIYAAAANAMERVPGGLSDVLYEFRVRQAGDNSGTNTSYAAEGHPMVRIEQSDGAQSKFTIAHEYGHALLMATLNPPIDEDDIDYSADPGDAEGNHTIDSKEWQLVAAFEGFAHFVAARTWNDFAYNADGVYVLGGNALPGNNIAYPLDVFDRVFETDFDPAQFPDQGVELDWAQFFWNYHTDQFDALLPVPVPVLVNMWLNSYPWPEQAGFFPDFLGGVMVTLPAWQPQFDINFKVARFLFMADLAGIDH